MLPRVDLDQRRVPVLRGLEEGPQVLVRFGLGSEKHQIERDVVLLELLGDLDQRVARLRDGAPDEQHDALTLVLVLPASEQITAVIATDATPQRAGKKGHECTQRRGDVLTDA